MARRTKLNYQEGDVVRIELPRGHQALCLVARTDGKGRCLGYFFLGDPDTLSPKEADLVQRCGDLGILQGRWELLGPVQGFDRSDWPVPAFGYHDLADPTLYFVRTYSDNLDLLGSRPASAKEVAGLPKDGLGGFGAVETVLSAMVEERRKVRKAPAVAARRARA